jgi:O-antigen ligase/Flp pilus assembly protein TadD
MSNHRAKLVSILLVVALPLLSFPLSWLPHGIASMRFHFLLPIATLVLAALLLLGARQLLNGEVAIRLPWRCLWPLFMVAGWLLAVRFSLEPHLSISLLPLWFANIGMLWVGMHVASEQRQKLFQWWVVAGVAVAMNGLVRLGSEREFLSTIGNRNFLAAYLAATIVIAISLRGKWMVMAIIPLVAALYFCQSRGAWLALLIAGALGYIVHGQEAKNGLLKRSLVVIALVSAVTVVFFASIKQVWQSDVRPVIWRSTIEMIAGHPMLGYGLGTFLVNYPQFREPEYFLREKAAKVTDHPHNELLEVGAEQGIVGVLSMLCLWGIAFVQGVRASGRGTDRKSSLACLGAATVLIVHAMIDVGLRYPPNQPLFWLLLGMLIISGESPGETAGSTERFHFAIRTRAARLVTAGAGLVVALWVIQDGIIQPIRADLADRAARLAEGRGDLNAASSLAWQALAVQPFRLSTRYLLANVLSRKDKSQSPDMAIEQCERIMELAPDYADITYNLGQLYLASGQPMKAVTLLKRAVQINPYDPDRRVTFAYAMALIGEKDMARQELQAALRLNPQHAGALHLQTQLNQLLKP